MRRTPRLISAAVLIALGSALSGCGSTSGLDPTDLLDFLDTKKPLPGERKPVFPEGVPGLEQGVPKHLYRGANNEPAMAEPPPAPAAAEEPKLAGSGAAGHHHAPAAPSSSPFPAPLPGGSFQR